ncbi:MAG: tail fiber domain-containing protein, partial [Planctomycetaceae bacterium]|nr:tail fiber domain-containing protein [Planctomycetaceae bacterium]
AHCTAAGVWTDASSRTHKEQIEPIDRETATMALQAFEPVTYQSKGDATGERYAGFIAEDVPDIVATTDRKGVAAIEVVAVVTKVVQEQQATIEAQKAEIDELKLRLEEIEALLGKKPAGQ